MLKRHYLHPESETHQKIYHSIMYGGLHHFFMGVSLLYAIILSFLGTWVYAEYFSKINDLINYVFIGAFFLELILKFLINPRDFIKHSWNIVEVALLILSIFLPPILVLRVLRFFIYLYTFLDHPIINRVVHTFIHSLPTLIMSSSVLGGCMFCYSLFATEVFGEKFPELFGTLTQSLFTFVQLMTFDDWMGSILKPVMEVYPLAWIVFFSFVLLVVFGILNIFMGVIVNAMNFVDDSSDDTPSTEDLKNQIEELKTLILKQEEVRNIKK